MKAGLMLGRYCNWFVVKPKNLALNTYKVRPAASPRAMAKSNPFNSPTEPVCHVPGVSTRLGRQVEKWLTG
ncbi:hypothetical protein D9M71_830900 [compost metagenome]